MATLRQIQADPREYLGTTDDPEIDEEALRLFEHAARRLMAQGMCSEDACAQVWGEGDFIPRAQAIITGG
jgi:hypothetical protein